MSDTLQQRDQEKRQIIARNLAVDAVREAHRLLVEGSGDDDVQAIISQRFPGVDVRAVVVAAGDRIAQAAGCERRVVVGFALEAYREVYRRALECGDLNNAIKAMKELVSLARSEEPDVFDDDEEEIENGQGGHDSAGDGTEN